jgi:two-component system, chemotaxis family, protein-glutamate methylesterase/glutaminase
MPMLDCDMRDIICIGASAGGVEVLIRVMEGFSAELKASVFVVLHVPAHQPSHLANILDRAGPLPVSTARDGERFERGHVYVASPDHHLLIEAGKMIVVKGPKENRFRPSIDALFRSGAQHYRGRCIGVVLSGALDDGTAGLWAIKRAGGTTVIQTDASFSEMPQNASAHIRIDHSAPAVEISALLSRLSAATSRRAKFARKALELTRIETDYAKLKNVPRERLEDMGTRSSLICPQCNGPLWQIDKGPRRFRCHTGHAFSPAALIGEHRELADRTLSVLMTLFDDEVTLLEHVAETATNREQAHQATLEITESKIRAAALRELLPGGFKQYAATH